MRVISLDFEDDFAGRLSQKEIQATYALVEVVTDSLHAIVFGIATVIASVLDRLGAPPIPDVDAVDAVDADARRLAEAARGSNLIVNTHATFRWRHGLFYAFDYDQMQALDDQARAVSRG